MTPEEKQRFTIMDDRVEKILRAVEGDSFTGRPGLIQEVKEMRVELQQIRKDHNDFKANIDRKTKGLKPIILSFAIGLAAGGVVIGATTGKALLTWLLKFL